MNLEEIEEELEEIPLTEHEWDMVAWLVAEVKRLRKELGSANDAIVLLKTRLKQLQKAVEIEHDQGESFLVQTKELREENAALRKDKDRLDWLEKCPSMMLYIRCLQENDSLTLRAAIDTEIGEDSGASDMTEMEATMKKEMDRAYKQLGKVAGDRCHRLALIYSSLSPKPTYQAYIETPVYGAFGGLMETCNTADQAVDICIQKFNAIRREYEQQEEEYTGDDSSRESE